ncbi:RagB/SusD family nutrient uptake outer membrane protein [Chitinophaga ginsengisoli]|uniref:SusD-like starch-binding protein associating with outer membrane n=1 Tax=Chitinophaga ginsengisoli TaxID=363837 RepID=A0A2P8GQ63_9BACT|nr:RagB/SusD family nutrient uptake outer membrane protein [Chitinophaga ginsengisoli]PSL36108.1 SusD-like starch-binding protein associating with outer membrane [Chitinophaga ginsengisoli]
MKNINLNIATSRSKFSFSIVDSVCFMFVLLCPAIICLSGCRKMIEIDMPINKYPVEKVFDEKNTAVAALSGVYAVIGSGEGSLMTGDVGLSLRSGFMADELSPLVMETVPEYQNVYNAKDGWPIWWMFVYRDYIYQLNTSIIGLENSTKLASVDKNILLGEAKFTRAWLYFNLVNFYGGVPIVLTNDFRINEKIARSPASEVYKQIEEDLKFAKLHLTENYLNRELLDDPQERVRPNKFAATALLARVYLYLGRWQEAEQEADQVISNSAYELLTDLNQVFLKNSKETIWALQPNVNSFSGVNTPDAKVLINRWGFLDPDWYLSSLLTSAFEMGDMRKTAWTQEKAAGYIAYKYKQGYGTSEQTEYTIVLRIAEQYLIRSEARAMQDKLLGDHSAVSDLNLIRARAGLSETSAKTRESILAAISKERQVELFLEWGDRWLNLKRTGNLNEVMTEVSKSKGVAWQPYKSLLPIPYDEFKWNPSLRGHQNPGYGEQP